MISEMFSPRQLSRLLDIANMACHKGMVADARRIFETVLALKPGFVPATVGLAFSHVVVDDFDNALAILDRVLAEHGSDPDALAMQGLACILAGRREEAEQAFARIPQDSTAADMARVVMEGV